MPIGDTLEKYFGMDTEVSIESAALEFVTKGPNIKSKTILPFTRYALGVSFLERLAQDIDTEMGEVTDIYNQLRIDELQVSNKDFKPKIKGKDINFRYERLSDNILPILDETMTLMPSMEGKAREQLKDVLRWLREEKAKVPHQDSLNMLQRQLTQ